MTNKQLAELMYPNVKNDIEYFELKYPKRTLKEGAIVTRFAPSPTGFVHMGSLLTAFIAKKVTKDTSGVFFLRIEDTDQKRSVDNGIQGILNDLSNFDIIPDEGVISESEEKGLYGPYIQSNRIDIYNVYAKYLVENGYAYPCFCSNEEMLSMRESQEQQKIRIGYYGKYAKCRDMSNEEKAKRIKNKEKYVLRLKSTGDYNKKIIVNDAVRGKIEFPENDIDHILIKSDGIPVYHFAHVIDDHLMRTTYVLRGEEWMSSTPLHIELFNKLGFKVPKYAHLGLLMKIDEEGVRRKLSKRKDPEAAVDFYHKMGIPLEAVKLYLMTIANSNFEAWMDSNKDKTIDEYKFDFKKMSVSGSLFDVDKLMNISKNYLSKLNATDIYNNLLDWTYIYDKDFNTLLKKYKNYSIEVFNIERDCPKPRKDYTCYSDIINYVWYMYDELFDYTKEYEFGNISDIEEIKKILTLYLEKYYNETDSEEEWFDKLKNLASELNYAREVKEYKTSPDKYKGHIGDVTMVLRVVLTTKSKTPNLYQIMRILGKTRIFERVNNFFEK